MFRSSTCKNLIQPVMIRSLTCQHPFQHVMIRSLTCHHPFLHMQGSVPTCKDPFHHMSSSVPSCHDPFLRTRSPLRLWHSTSSNVMYNRPLDNGRGTADNIETTKTHYEMALSMSVPSCRTHSRCQAHSSSNFCLAWSAPWHVIICSIMSWPAR